MGKLKITSSGHEYDLSLPRITIGRDSDNDFVIDDESVSGHHAEIQSINGNCVLRDLGSTNGTAVNGASVHEITLNNGDFLQFGGVHMSFEGTTPSAAIPPPFPPESFGQRLLRVGQAAAKSAKRTASIAAKQAQLKKLEVVDLAAADLALGTKAFECSLFKAEFHALYEELSAIETQIASLKVARNQIDGATLGEKAKYAAHVTKNQAQLEVAAFKKNGLIAKLGEAIRQSMIQSTELGEQLQCARSVDARIKLIEGQVRQLQSEKSFKASEHSEGNSQMANGRPYPYKALIIAGILTIFLIPLAVVLVINTRSFGVSHTFATFLTDNHSKTNDGIVSSNRHDARDLKPTGNVVSLYRCNKCGRTKKIISNVDQFVGQRYQCDSDGTPMVLIDFDPEMK